MVIEIGYPFHKLTAQGRSYTDKEKHLPETFPYHSKENVDTSNTMLMMSRLYNYNADKFFEMLNTRIIGQYFACF